MEWPGFLYDGNTADRQPVTVTLKPAGVAVHRSDGSTMLWPVGELRQTQGSFSGEQLKIEFGTEPTMAVIVDAPGFVEAMRRTYPGVNRTIRGQAQTTRFALWSIVALVAVAVLYFLGAPTVATTLASRVPPEWEATLGREVANDLAPQARRCTDSLALAVANGELQRLLSAASSNPYAFSLAIVKDTIVNAFAAPGGFVVVFSGLMDAAETPEQFAGVLAHEIQHVLHRHTTRSIIRDAPIRMGIAAVFGGTSAQSGAELVGSLSALRYRRDDETEADRDGLRLMQAAKIDPIGMIEFMHILEKRDGIASRIPAYLSSHPQTAERTKQLAALVGENQRAAPRKLDAAQWREIRGRCRP